MQASRALFGTSLLRRSFLSTGRGLEEFILPATEMKAGEKAGKATCSLGRPCNSSKECVLDALPALGCIHVFCFHVVLVAWPVMGSYPRNDSLLVSPAFLSPHVDLSRPFVSNMRFMVDILICIQCSWPHALPAVSIVESHSLFPMQADPGEPLSCV